MYLELRLKKNSIFLIPSYFKSENKIDAHKRLSFGEW